MSDTAINTQSIRFPCMSWEVQGESIHPIRGTWALPPPETRHIFKRLGVEEKVKGLVACPNCGKASILIDDMVTEDKVEHVGVMALLRCSDCPLACQAILEGWDTRRLYCVAFETMGPNGILANKEYYHGNSQEDVAGQFANGHVQDTSIVRVVAIGTVIGYFVDDNQGLKLHV